MGGAALGGEHEPLSEALHQDGPRRAPPGANRPCARTQRTHRAIPGFAPCWQLPSGDRCQAAKATCSWGRARATLPTQRRGQERSKMAPASGRQLLPRPGRPGQASPGAATSGEGGGGSPRVQPWPWQVSSLIPPGLHTGPTCLLYWFGTYASAKRAPARPWVSWSLDTGTGLSLLCSRLPDDTWGGWTVRVIGAIIAPFVTTCQASGQVPYQPFI